MLGGYSLGLRSYRVVSVAGTASFRWTSSSGAIGLSTSSRLKGYTILPHWRKSLGWCQTWPTPIGIGKVDIFCSRDELGVPSRRVGDDASWFWQYLGHRQIFKFSTVYIFTFFFIYLSQVFNVIHFSLFSASVRPHITDKQEALIRWVLEIPFDERRCKDLITLDT